MDLTQLYMSSPDWIKGLMVVLPWLTLYAIARLVLPKPAPSPLERPVAREQERPLPPIVIEGEAERHMLDEEREEMAALAVLERAYLRRQGEG